MTAAATSAGAIEGYGLELRPWDADLVRQMAGWGERGFPFHAFDLGHLRDQAKAEAALLFAHQKGPHQHYIAAKTGGLWAVCRSTGRTFPGCTSGRSTCRRSRRGVGYAGECWRR